MGPQELYWLIYLCVLLCVNVCLVDLSLGRRYSAGVTAASWAGLILVPVVVTALLQDVPPFFSDLWPNRTVPRAGIPLLILPLFPLIGSRLLYDGGNGSVVSAAMYSYILSATVCGLVCIALADVTCAVTGIEGSDRMVLLPASVVAGTVLVACFRGRMRSEITGFCLSGGNGLRKFSRISVLMGVSVHMCMYLCLFEFGYENRAVTILTMMMAVLFLATMDMMLMTMNEASSKARIDAELGAAHDLQASVLCSDVPPWMPGVAVSACMEPAKTVGGDFYDSFPVDDHRMAFVVADVSDKGVPAALFMMRAHGVVRGCLAGADDLGSAATRVGESLSENNPTCMFATMFIGVLDVDDGALEYVNAGHVDPVLRHGNGDATVLTGPRGPIMGVRRFGYTSGRTVLGRGDVLTVFTDGVTEAPVGDGFYGQGNVTDVLRTCVTPDDAVHRLRRDVLERSDAVTDDLTVLSLSYTPSTRGTFGADPDGAASCMDMVRSVSEGLGPSSGARMELVAEEVAMNIASHSGAGSFTITIQTGDAVTMTFVDDGAPFDPTSVPGIPDGVPPERDGPGGNGVRLIRGMSDGISYTRSSGRNVLTVKIEERK
ncbi:MAG: SpoIIE family protein phosphatase [Candidatus Methanomethylophilaceae archaeon]|nr:SpoIIE family protein phosphatase [Candidatus Methanomethylophilaceae archaeon]